MCPTRLRAWADFASMGGMSLISELQRRNVIRVAMAYVAVAWLVVQVLDTLAPVFGLGDDTVRLIVILLAIGLVPSLIVSWLFEFTPEGFRRESTDPGPMSARSSTRTLDRLIIGTLAVAVVYFAVDKYVFDPARDARLASEAAEEARDEALLGRFGDNSVAVLPFTDMSPAADQAYFSDGITEEIINLLAQVRDLRVISRSSAFAFKGHTLPISEVAERLNVRYVLEGSVRRAGDNLRITASMVDARTDTQLWSENFDREFGDIFAIQDQIAGEVVNRLEVELAGGMPTSVVVDPEAFALYLRAREFVNRQRADATALAEQALQESLAIDDQHAAAWLLYVPIYGQKLSFQEINRAEWQKLSLAAIDKALEIDPDNVEARALQARNSPAAIRTLAGGARAVAYGMSLDPLRADFNQAVGLYLRSLGLAERALPFYEYAAKRDPLAARAWRGLMLAYLYAGRFEQALEANTTLREIVGNDGGLWNRGMIFLMLDDPVNALSAFEGWYAGNPESIHAYHGLFLAHTRLGNDAAAQEFLQKLEAADGNEELMASVHAWQGRIDESFTILEDLVEPPRTFGPRPLAGSPLFPGLDEDPRWQALLEQQGTSAAQIRELGLDELFPGPSLPPRIEIEKPPID